MVQLGARDVFWVGITDSAPQKGTALADLGRASEVRSRILEFDSALRLLLVLPLIFCAISPQCPDARRPRRDLGVGCIMFLKKIQRARGALLYGLSRRVPTIYTQPMLLPNDMYTHQNLS